MLMALYYMLWRHHHPLVNRSLFMFSVNTDATDNFGRTPFNLAAKENNLKFAKFLLECSDCSLVNTKDSNGKSPLDYVRDNGNEAFIALVIAQNPLEIRHNISKRKDSAVDNSKACSSMPNQVKLEVDLAINPMKGLPKSTAESAFVVLTSKAKISSKGKSTGC